MVNETALKILRQCQRERMNGHVPRKRGESDEAYNARRADILQRERQALTRQLVFLNDLAYIIECVAQTYTGEAKTEISVLSRKLEDIENPAEAERYGEAYLKLDEAWFCLSSGDGHRAAGILSSISRSLWKRILPPD
ncbi:MAG: hypothetical protein RBU21_25030 [FCB group bacterium]|jgi:hypothetical protein|nr:hypothetical protein [FCB group bacterium]